MNIKQLSNLLKEAKVPKSNYYLNIKFPGDKYSNGDRLCIGINKGRWEVYYTERGAKFDIMEFDDETGACEYFFKKIMQSEK